MINIREVFSENFTKGFDDIKDLVRGTVTVDKIENLIHAYHHFRKTPGIEIIDVKDVAKLINLQNITVNFIFENRFIGEMQFRFSELPPHYHANHFLYEIGRSSRKIEILQSLSK